MHPFVCDTSTMYLYLIDLYNLNFAWFSMMSIKVSQSGIGVPLGVRWLIVGDSWKKIVMAANWLAHTLVLPGILTVWQ